jgi:carbamoyltransferase
VLNTSFNVKGQPIVNTPTEAIETYLRTGIDYLFIENTLIRRKCSDAVLAPRP